MVVLLCTLFLELLEISAEIGDLIYRQCCGVVTSQIGLSFSRVVWFITIFGVIWCLVELVPTYMQRIEASRPVQPSLLTSVPVYDIRSRPYRVSNGSKIDDGLTVVTAYFNIGSFGKGSSSNKFTPALYEKWLNVFKLIDSPVTGFFDNDEFANRFLQLRRQFPSNLTVVHKLNRTQMWSFGLVPNISRIFAKPGYPKHYPNTVVPNYSAAMHAKYEVMQLAILENPFNTRYFCWLDIGLFRDISESTAQFSLYLPPNYKKNSVAYQQVYGSRNRDTSVADIIRKNMVWVCGCFFVAEATVMYRWTQEYKDAAYRLIKEHELMSTDQQVIYAAFNTMNVSTEIQTFKADGRYNEWFHLGYLARDAGLERRIRHSTDPSQ